MQRKRYEITDTKLSDLELELIRGYNNITNRTEQWRGSIAEQMAYEILLNDNKKYETKSRGTYKRIKIPKKERPAGITEGVTKFLRGTLEKYYDKCIEREEEKMQTYKNRFDTVKNCVKRREYMMAEELCKKLEEDLIKQIFFYPSKNLYKEIESYKREIIEPRVRKIKWKNFKKRVRKLLFWRH